MKILVIEDDDNKFEPIKVTLQNIFNSKILVEQRRSYQSGLEALYHNSFDLLILDMSIPNFDISQSDDGGDTLDRGGEYILEEMNRESIVIKSIIITQYEEFGGVSLAEIDANLKQDFSDSYLGCISYNTGYDSWKIELEELIKEKIC